MLGELSFTQDILRYRLIQDQPEYMTVFCGKPGAFTSYIGSRWKAKHPDRIQKVYIVKGNEYADQ